MTASITGEIRPFSDRIDAALILAESATAILDKHPKPEVIQNAAKALIQAGLTLLLDSTEAAYILPEQRHQALFSDLSTCKGALELVLGDEDLSAGVQSVTALVVEKLERHIDDLDAVTLHLAGLAVEFEEVGRV